MGSRQYLYQVILELEIHIYLFSSQRIKFDFISHSLKMMMWWFSLEESKPEVSKKESRQGYLLTGSDACALGRSLKAKKLKVQSSWTWCKKV